MDDPQHANGGQPGEQQVGVANSRSGAAAMPPPPLSGELAAKSAPAGAAPMLGPIATTETAELNGLLGIPARGGDGGGGGGGGPRGGQ